MRRPALLALVVCGLLVGVGAPLAGAPPASPRLGVLDLAESGTSAANLAALRQGLRDLGYVEGRNLAIEYRSAAGRAERLPDLARELVTLRPDVIVTTTSSAALAARHVTATIPIVMASSGDPVFAGLVASLTRPGGNVTGLHGITPPAVAGTRLRLLKEAIPAVSRVGVLLDPGDAYALDMLREVERVARTLGLQLHRIEGLRPGELERGFEAALAQRIDALLTLEGTITRADLTRIVEFAALGRLPAISGLREFVEAGGLMAYGIDSRDMFRRSATHVHRILGGANPAELPVEPPVTFALAINQKTARALGLTLPPSLLQRADDLIQ
jgi:putative tryptophan/tyrosine transport system substrate-binding protein